ncbi:MAG: RelA/SpoT domain-containing protein [Candidatus Woesearchaeota archaeon]
MIWTKPKYSNNRINQAGEVLRKAGSTEISPYTFDDFDEAMLVLNNWRSAHSFPLQTFAMRLKIVSKNIDSYALVIRRLKRASSIIKKLQRGQTEKMQMSRMQDVGGCRAVMKGMSETNALINIYLKKSRGLKHKLTNTKDYITYPKKDGYRSFHLVYKYFSDKNAHYNGLLIEIQIRTKLQHYWATAVETVDHFTGQAIKSNEGRQEWMDFFKLVSSAFAVMENTPIVPDTPDDKNELKKQIRILAKRLSVIKKMTEWAKIHKFIETVEKGGADRYDYYLLNLNLDSRELNMSAFKKSEEERANAEYSKLEEKMIKNKENRDIVLVSADTVRDLRKAYPNYFLDAKEFIEKLTVYLKDDS